MTRQDSPVEWGDDVRRPFVDALPAVFWMLTWMLFVALVVYAAMQRGGR